ncbi:MAG: hypothetical protein RSA22_00830 [Acinetobacter sp.]
MVSFIRENSLFLIEKQKVGFWSNLLPIYIYEEDDLDEPSKKQLSILKYLENSNNYYIEQMNLLFLDFCNIVGGEVVGKNPSFEISDISIPNLADLNEVIFVVGAKISWDKEMDINFFIFNSTVIACDYIDAIFYGTSWDKVIHSQNMQELKENIRLFLERYFHFR